MTPTRFYEEPVQPFSAVSCGSQLKSVIYKKCCRKEVLDCLTIGAHPNLRLIFVTHEDLNLCSCMVISSADGLRNQMMATRTFDFFYACHVAGSRADAEKRCGPCDTRVRGYHFHYFQDSSGQLPFQGQLWVACVSERSKPSSVQKQLKVLQFNSSTLSANETVRLTRISLFGACMSCRTCVEAGRSLCGAVLTLKTTSTHKLRIICHELRLLRVLLLKMWSTNVTGEQSDRHLTLCAYED